MDRQPGQMTIWLVVPSGFAMDHELAAVLVGSVADLSVAVAGEPLGNCWCGESWWLTSAQWPLKAAATPGTIGMGSVRHRQGAEGRTP